VEKISSEKEVLVKAVGRIRNEFNEMYRLQLLTSIQSYEMATGYVINFIEVLGEKNADKIKIVMSDDRLVEVTQNDLNTYKEKHKRN